MNKTHRAITHVERTPEEEIDLQPLQFFRLMVRLFRYTRPYRRMRNWLLAAVVVRAMLLPSLAWTIGAVINGPISRHDPKGVLLGAVGFGLLALVTQVFFGFRIQLALSLGTAIVRDLRVELFAHIQTMTASFFHRMKIGSIISRLTSDVEAVRIGIQDVVFIGIVQVGQMLFSAALMLYYDWVLFLVMLAMAPAIWVLNRYFTTRLSDAQRRASESFSRVTATMAESVSGIRVTQGFVREQVNATLFRELIADHSRINMGAARMTAIFLPLLELNSQFFIAMLLLLGGYRVLSPDVAMPVGNIVQFFFLSNLFFDPIRVLGTQYTQALTSMVGAERVFRLLDTPSDWSDPTGAVSLRQIEGRVEFVGLGFGYNPKRLVLQDINFVAHPGQTIALVGHTGSGKTSITSLVSKSYLPSSGKLLIDGRDIVTLASKPLRRQIGVVHQQNFLFEGTVLENIRFSRPEATEAEVVEAARRLDSLELLEALPAGLQTVVGENGSGLSLGQRQIICFTRALLADPRILILDEATSSIDALTEMRIQRALQLLLKGRTSFVIAHRLSTIRQADQILVIDHGRIAERGTHQELLAAGGLYHGMHRQFVATAADAEERGR